jgi:hypothetical protein
MNLKHINLEFKKMIINIRKYKIRVEEEDVKELKKFLIKKIINMLNKNNYYYI